MGGSTDGGGITRNIETDGMHYLHEAVKESGLLVVSSLLPKYDTGNSLLTNFGKFHAGEYELQDQDALQFELVVAPKINEYDLEKLTDRLGAFSVNATKGMKTLKADNLRQARYTKRGKRLAPATITIREDLGEHPVVNAINLRLDLGHDIPPSDNHTVTTDLFAATNIYLFPSTYTASRAEITSKMTAEAALNGRKLKLVRQALAHHQAFRDLVPKLA